MTLLFCDGFDHYSAGAALQKWDLVYDPYNSFSIGSEYSRSATGQGCRLYGYNDNYLIKTIPERDTVIFGMAMKLDDVQYNSDDIGIILHNDTGPQVTLVSGTSNNGNLDLRLGPYNGAIIATSSYLTPINSWFYLELKVTVNNTTGSYELRINGVDVLSDSGVDTQYQSAGGITKIQFGSLFTGSYDYQYIDDLYICDTNGSINNDFLGDVVIKTLYPTSDGTHTDFTPSTGTDHYALVDEAQMDDSDYNTADAAGDIDSFNMDDITVEGDVVGLQVVAMSGNSGEGTATGAALVRSGSTPADNVGDNVAIASESSGAVMGIWEQEPEDVTDWTQTNINAAEFGVKMIS